MFPYLLRSKMRRMLFWQDLCTIWVTESTPISLTEIFSHIFKSKHLLINTSRKYNLPQWEHEDASIELLKYLIDQNNIDMESKDVNFVGRLIKGDVKNEVEDEKSMIKSYLTFI